MDQSILDAIVKLATDRAMSGCPVAKILWIPPDVAENPGGGFVIKYSDYRESTLGLTTSVIRKIKKTHLST